MSSTTVLEARRILCKALSCRVVNATCVSTVMLQVEAFDSEIESLQSTVKRKQKPPARLAHLEESVTRHKTHIGRLEQIIRLLDNDALQPDDVSRVVLEEIPEYIENNQEDFDAYEVRGVRVHGSTASLPVVLQ